MYRWQGRIVLLLSAWVLGLGGCAFHVDWPDLVDEEPAAKPGCSVRSYRIGEADAPNYEQALSNGRIVELRFDDDGDGTADATVDLREPTGSIPHFMVILDGVPFDVVEAMYAEGHFRLFAPPVRVISTFPAMTDVALSRLFHTRPCIATEASYFDRTKNRMSSGNDVYMSGDNAPWMPAVDYHAPQNVAVATYLSPASVFSRELRDMHRLFATTDAQWAAGYSVGAAGIGTRGGEPAIRSFLAEIDRLCERITYNRRGRVRFTITADHGHGLKPCERVSFREALIDAGFHPKKTITGPDDVVIVSYGLVTYAQFFTDRPADVAETLRGHAAVDLAMYPTDEAVVVLNADGEATVRQEGNTFLYQPIEGDPLRLTGLLPPLPVDGSEQADAPLSERAVLEATAQREYPDPLRRIWLAFHGLVAKPADVIVSLKPGACHGSKFFHFFIAPVESTHGSLGRLSSATFLLTNAVEEPLPEVIRIEDVLDTVHWKSPGSHAGDAPLSQD
jgi:hypothetical protein